MEKNMGKNIYKIVLAFVGVLLVGTGIAFNAMASLGNDPITLFYDGIKHLAGLSDSQLGVATNLVNITLMVLVFFLNKHYVNIGTFIYILPLGTVIDSVIKVLQQLSLSNSILSRSLLAVAGCVILAMGIGLFIAIDMGVDPVTGVVLVLCDKTKKDYKIVKTCFDFGCVIVGILLGGKFGVVTVLTAMAMGTLISYFTGVAKKLFVGEEAISAVTE